MSTDTQNNTTNCETNTDGNQTPELNDEKLNYDDTL